MKRVQAIALRVLIICALWGAAKAQTTYFWTGFGSGWQGQGTPPNDGTALLYLPDAINETVALPVNLGVFGIYLQSDDTYKFSPASGATLPLTLGISTGALIGTSSFGKLKFDPNINLNLSGSPVFDYGSGTMYVSGHITGSVGTLNLTTSDNVNYSGAYVFNNTGTGNSYTGNTFIAPLATGGEVIATFWNDAPFSTGTVSLIDDVYLIAHGTRTLANALTLGTTTTTNFAVFKSWDAPLTLSGAVTLAGNTTLIAQPGVHGVSSLDNAGVFPTPGAPSRYPIVFTGNLGQSGTHSLTIGGAGIVILQPTTGLNTYTGGTVVNGTLIFGNNNAMPTGAGNVTVNASGYVGIGDTSVNNFGANLLAHVNTASAGAVGVDTLPGNSTITYANPINLTGFTNTSIRIGTATSAILSGVISPQGANYQFGNGGGTLFIQSNLPNVSTVSQLQLTDALNTGLVYPLKLFLQGTNTYTGGTLANNGFVIFDGASSLPASGQLTAAGTSTTNGASYIGYTDAVGSVAPVTPAAFLAKFNLANTWGIIGFDTHAGNATVNIANPVNLTGFNNGVFLGTATSATLSGTLTPTADNILRLTAANGGTLTVSSNITGGTAVMLGTPSTDYHYSDGTLILTPATANTYTGGTTFNNAGPLTVVVGGTTPLGSGPLTIPNTTGNFIGLQAATPNYTLGNNLVFQNTVPGNYSVLYLTGTNSLVLSGTISGPGDLNVTNTTATLSGDNSAFTGDLGLLNGTLYLNHNNAAGTGTLNFNGINTDSVIFSGAATAPVLHGILGDTGSLVLGAGNVLTFDTSNPSNEHEFGGSIGAGGPVNASVVVTSTPGGNGLYLYGSSNYTGGTTITNYGLLGVGQSTSLGSGPVNLTSATAILALNQGVTLTNPLNYTAGTLQGFGTFAPSNLTSLTIGGSKSVVPGLFESGNMGTPGTLTLGTDVVFADFGRFGWSLQDVSRVDGHSQLIITGNLDLNSISNNGFTVVIATFDAVGDLGLANLTIGTPYTFTILQASGGISGFSASKFSLDVTQFENGTMPASVFSVTADANNIYLNFTAIPEPSTWMLLGTGASLLGLAARRRIRAARAVVHPPAL